MIQFLLRAECLLLKPVFNGVVLFHVNGRSAILVYSVALASGLVEDLPSFSYLPEEIVPLQLKSLSKGAGKHALLFKLNSPL